jgi:hypothetical protein
LAWAAVPELGGGILHSLELVDRNGLPLAWVLGVARRGVLHVEELFVKPQFRRRGYGNRLIRAVSKLAHDRGCEIKIWISYADVRPENLRVIDKLSHSIGLGLILPHYDPPAAIAPDTWKSVVGFLVGGASAGITAAVSNLVYQIVRSRVDSKNGRRIRVKNGDFELETTQLSEEEFLKLLGTLRDAESNHQIKSKLLDAGFSDRQ